MKIKIYFNNESHEIEINDGCFVAGVTYVKIDTGLVIPGSEKTLRFHVTKVADGYAFHLGHLSRLKNLSVGVSIDDGNVTSLSIIEGKGNFNTLLLTPIASNVAALHQKNLYSKREGKAQEYVNEVIRVGKLAAKVDDFLTQYPQLFYARQGLAFPHTIRGKRGRRGLIGVNKSPFVVHEIMPNGDGGSLYTLQKNTVSICEIAALKSLVEALLLLWASGIAHLDIKPANIIKTGATYALIDFGFSDSITQPASYDQILGSPGYVLPQKWSYLLKGNGQWPTNAEPYDPIANDLYALCAAFLKPFFNLAGYSPFDGINKTICSWWECQLHIKRWVSDGNKLYNAVLEEINRHFGQDSSSVEGKTLRVMLNIYRDAWKKLGNKSVPKVSQQIEDLAQTLAITDTVLLNQALANVRGADKVKSRVVEMRADFPRAAQTTTTPPASTSAAALVSLRQETRTIDRAIVEPHPELIKLKTFLAFECELYSEKRFVQEKERGVHWKWFCCCQFTQQHKQSAVTALQVMLALDSSEAEIIEAKATLSTELSRGALKNKRLGEHIVQAYNKWNYNIMSTARQIPQELGPIVFKIASTPPCSAMIVDTLLKLITDKHFDPIWVPSPAVGN